MVAAIVSDARVARFGARAGGAAIEAPAGDRRAVPGGRHGVRHGDGDLPVARNLADADTAKAEPILLGVDEDLGPDDVAVVGRKIDDILHPDGKLAKKDEQFERRWLKINDLLDGMATIEGLLDPELKNRLRAALDPLAKPAGDDDIRTAGQRYADALNTVLGGTRQTHMSVTVNLEALTGGREPGTFPDGSPLPAEDARRIALNAGISRVLTAVRSRPPGARWTIRRPGRSAAVPISPTSRSAARSTTGSRTAIPTSWRSRRVRTCAPPTASPANPAAVAPGEAAADAGGPATPIPVTDPPSTPPDRPAAEPDSERRQRTPASGTRQRPRQRRP